MAESGLLRGLIEALDFAAQRHRDQRRKGEEASPYINHPIHVTRLLVDVGRVSDAATLIAAILHDTIEDTETTGPELEARFGGMVRRLVEEVTDDRRLPKDERKRLQIERAPSLSEAAKQIKIADKISNIEDIVAAPPRNWSRARRLEYIDWAEAVVAGCLGVNEDLDNRWSTALLEAREQLDRIPG